MITRAPIMIRLTPRLNFETAKRYLIVVVKQWNEEIYRAEAVRISFTRNTLEARNVNLDWREIYSRYVAQEPRPFPENAAAAEATLTGAA